MSRTHPRRSAARMTSSSRGKGDTIYVYLLSMCLSGCGEVTSRVIADG